MTVSIDMTPKILDLPIGLDAHGMPDDKQKAPRQPANSKERGQEELRS